MSKRVRIKHGDCIEVLRELVDGSVDAVVTDPPYGIGFMGKQWDTHGALAFEAWCEVWATECLRVLKPGGHLLAFGGSRTWHRLASGIEDAGFELRDSIAWLYGSGFPKSLDVSKAIDKAAGAEREVVGVDPYSARRASVEGVALGERLSEPERFVTAPATPDAQKWAGWGTALKPAFEPIVVARKPLVGTVAANVLAHGTGALNIDASRIAGIPHAGGAHGTSIYGSDGKYVPGPNVPGNESGRWPANVILDESQAAALDAQSGTLTSGVMPVGTPKRGKPVGILGAFPAQPSTSVTYGDTGGASRFFYVAKAPRSERPKGEDGSAHPTVKPLALMRYLVRLVTPPDGLVLDPFAGSGTTLEAAHLEGFQALGIEREAEYLPLIAARLERNGITMGKKAQERERLEREAVATRRAAEAAEQARLDAMAAASAEPDAEPLTKAERKALKAQRKAQAANLAVNTGQTPEEAAAVLAHAEATAPKIKAKDIARAFDVPVDLVKAKGKGKGKGKAVATGAVVTSAPIPDVEDVASTAVLTTPGPGIVTELATPAEAKVSVEPIERDQWGRPKVMSPDGSKSVGYRRVTTFIDVLEDKTSLADWGKRNVLEGVAVDYSTGLHSSSAPTVVTRASTTLATRDTTLAKLRADNGPLSTALAEADALKVFKDAMDALVSEAEDIAGAHDKATKGTDLHAMSELVDAGLPLPDDATEADRRDIAAYQAAVKQAGIVYSHAEQFVVLDDLGVGGTLDRAGLYRFKDTARARRCVMDLKTGRIDYSPGKIAMQLATYAHGLAYDKDTATRTDLKLDKTKALLIHLPAGEGHCRIYEVDIATAWSKAVRLAEDVYAWRKLGKQAFNVNAPIVDVQL